MKLCFHVLLVVTASSLPLAAQPCCSITAIQPGGTVQAKVNTTGQQFQFTVTDASLLRSLRVGQGIYANFSAGQVSIDGRAACCRITGTTPSTNPSAPRPPATGTPTSAPQTGASSAVTSTAGIAPGQGPGWQLKHIDTDAGGRRINADVWRFTGASGVQASNLPPTYRDALARRAASMPPNSVLVVTKTSVDKWLQSHPPGTPQSLSVGSVVNDVVNACTEKPVSTTVPVQFNQPIDLPLTLNNTSLGGGVSATGKIDINFPFRGNFNVELKGYYEPCLFVTRPTALRAAGTLAYGGSISVDITKVNFQKDIPIPSSPLTVPLLHGALLIDGVPVEAGVDLFVQGGVAINAQADVDLRFFASAQASGPFDFSCDGGGCSASSGLTPTYIVADNLALNGHGVHGTVQPYVFGGLQLEVEGGSVLRAQIGPRPNLTGDVWAYTGQSCGNPHGPASAQTVNALTLDADAGIDVRYHLTAPGVDKSQILLAPKPIHLGFWDLLGHSTGLVADVVGNTQPAAGSTAAYNVHMKACYPYTDSIEYQVGFSNQTATRPVPVGLDRGTSGSPQAGLTVNHQWPSAGTFAITSSAVKDAHGRVFHADPTQLAVTVH